MKITDTQLQKLREHAIKAQRAVQGYNSYENLILHRSGFTNKTHKISLESGEIEERK